MSGTACGPVRFIDLFAGIGGIRLGFERAFRRHETVFVSEWDTYAQATYRTNFPTPAEIVDDITKISEKDVPSFDVCLASFPCQIFSVGPETKAERKKRAADENFRTGVFGADGRHIAVSRLKGFVVGHGAASFWGDSDYTGCTESATEDFVLRENADSNLSRSG